jgi:hypothetical protein
MEAVFSSELSIGFRRTIYIYMPQCLAYTNYMQTHKGDILLRTVILITEITVSKTGTAT